ncbi:hypothetical protein FOMPIDRAFT_1111043, partial [Fomitopsis schrenkii]
MATNPSKSGRNTKASLHIGSLNVCGKGSLRADTSGTNKWNSINQLAREKKLGLIAVQETHLSQQDVTNIHRIYGRCLLVINSAGENATAAGGVAVILNRELVDTKDVRCEVVIPGRAMLVTIHWHGDKKLTILNVYAPNADAENREFWESLEVKMASPRTPRPHVLLGDMNVVEDALDRLPPRSDSPNKVSALRSLVNRLRLTDGWRTTEPSKLDYSFPQRGAASRSRIDRIYVTEDLLQASTDWAISTTAVQTDHKLVSARISIAEAPHLGKGRWAMHVHALENKKLLAAFSKLGKEAIASVKATQGQCRSEACSNAQRILKDFKQEVVTMTRNALRESTPKLDRRIQDTKKEIERTQNEPGFAHRPGMHQRACDLQNTLVELERKRHAQVRSATAAKYVLNAEVPSKYWSAINKER